MSKNTTPRTLEELNKAIDSVTQIVKGKDIRT